MCFFKYIGNAPASVLRRLTGENDFMPLERQVDLNTDLYLCVCVCANSTHVHVHTHKQMYFMWKDWTLMSNTWQSADSELSKNPT